MRIVIRTRYRANAAGAGRIVATTTIRHCEVCRSTHRHQVTAAYDHSLNQPARHAVAARMLARKIGADKLAELPAGAGKGQGILWSAEL